MFRHRSSYQKKRRQSHVRARIGMILMLCAALATTALPPLTAGASTPGLEGTGDGIQITDLAVEVSAVEEVNADYLQITGTMSSTLQRSDGSSGSYKVPMLVIYPRHDRVCNNVGIVDIINSVFYETFPTTTGWSSQLARAVIGDDFLQSHGYVYANAEWNKLVFERQRELDVLEDETLHIDEGPDGSAILRDLSHVLRATSSFFAGVDQIPCASDDVIGFGYSQTGMWLRGFTFAGLNSQLASAPIFDDGLVFEGTMHGVPGSHCRRSESESLWYSYTFDGCTGATPADQGKVMTINTATDVQVIEGWLARPEDDSSDAYYRVYEITGTSHLPEAFFPLKAAEFRDAAHSDQNYADPFPVFRAMFEHLRAWVQEDQPPPPNAVIEGTVGTAAQPLFSGASWGSSGTDVFVESTGPYGSPLGGIRLPHLRTTLDNGRQIGAPLGIYRGTHCNNDPVPATFILDCQMSGDMEIYNIGGGTFTAYDASTCSALYGNPGRYTSAVNTAVGYAIAQGWVLPEERRAIVNAAEARAEQHLDCVSEPLPAVNITLTIDDTVDPGTEWSDPNGYHLRGLHNLESVSGDFSGDAQVTINIDATDETTSVWVDVDITTADGRWDGRYAQIATSSGTEARGLLIGRDGHAGHVLILDRVVEETENSLALSGHVLEMTRPVEGMTLSFDLCIDGTSHAGGGFLGNGPVPIDGSASADFTVIGSLGDGMVWGSVELTGADGTLNGFWLESSTPHPSAGNFVLLGGSGAYDGSYGYGHTRGSLHGTDQCASGTAVHASWLGEVMN